MENYTRVQNYYFPPPSTTILWLRVGLLRVIATGDLELNAVVVLVCIYIYIYGIEWYVRNYTL